MPRITITVSPELLASLQASKGESSMSGFIAELLAEQCLTEAVTYGSRIINVRVSVLDKIRADYNRGVGKIPLIKMIREALTDLEEGGKLGLRGAKAVVEFAIKDIEMTSITCGQRTLRVRWDLIEQMREQYKAGEKTGIALIKDLRATLPDPDGGVLGLREAKSIVDHALHGIRESYVQGWHMPTAMRWKISAVCNEQGEDAAREYIRQHLPALDHNKGRVLDNEIEDVIINRASRWWQW